MILLFLFFFNYYFITPSLRFLSSDADADLLKSEQTNVVVAFFLNWPQDYPALQILFLSPGPQSAHQAALWSSWAVPLAMGLRSRTRSATEELTWAEWDHRCRSCGSQGRLPPAICFYTPCPGTPYVRLGRVTWVLRPRASTSRCSCQHILLSGRLWPLSNTPTRLKCRLWCSE